MGATGAAVESAAMLDTVPYDLAAAMGADRGQGVDRALERVERVRPAIQRHGEGLVVIIAADLALRHWSTSRAGVDWSGVSIGLSR